MAARTLTLRAKFGLLALLVGLLFVLPTAVLVHALNAQRASAERENPGVASTQAPSRLRTQTVIRPAHLTPLLLLTTVLFLTIIGLGLLLMRHVLRQLGGEPAMVEALIAAIARGDAHVRIPQGTHATGITAALLKLQDELEQQQRRFAESSRSAARTLLDIINNMPSRSSTRPWVTAKSRFCSTKSRGHGPS